MPWQRMELLERRVTDPATGPVLGVRLHQVGSYLYVVADCEPADNPGYAREGSENELRPVLDAAAAAWVPLRF